MKQGRELDALVAEKVMGFPVWHDETPPGHLMFAPFEREPTKTDRNPPQVKRYSTDIADAWEVLQKFGKFWIDHTAPNLGIEVEVYTSSSDAKADADALPHAICLAALKALNVEIPS